MNGLLRAGITAPFFEIGPKNLLRRDAIEAVAIAAGAAGATHGVTVLVTVPTAMIAPVHDLGAGVLVLAQGMGTAGLGPSMDVVTPESLIDAGAAGVMLNHDANPLDDAQLALAIERARGVGLLTVVCADTDADAVRFAALQPDVVLLEPPALIGADAADAVRPWIPASSAAIHVAGGDRRVHAMHAGGVASAAIAEAIMAAGADGTGSTSGVLGGAGTSAADRADAAHAFIAATRLGWDRARAGSAHPHQIRDTRTTTKETS
ncbi:triose-phosphate isomerase [Agrococcus versicolor]|uniref:Triose-phosphate isomerase n=1 Tax=Agrococcus versicolor TaxID=501482 RepID=A0ABN3AYH1_9MICO